MPFDVKKIDNAIENLIRSINFYSKKESSYNLAFAYYNLGKCYLEIEKNELSEIYFKKASDIYESLNLLDAILVSVNIFQKSTSFGIVKMFKLI